MPIKITVLITIIVLISPIAALSSGFGLSAVIDSIPAVPAPVPDDLIIGDDPVDETMVITDFYSYRGDIHVINQGTLIVQGPAGHLVIDGNLYVRDTGIFRVSGGTFTLNQTTRYQYGFSVENAGTVEFNSAEIRCNGMPGNAYFVNQATVSYTDTTSDIHCTAMAGDDAVVAVTQSTHSLELIITGRAEATFTGSSGSILWLGFTAGNIADFTMPDTSGTLDWEFSSDLPGVSGVEFRLTVSGCTEMLLGLISWETSDVTVRDSDVRVLGIYFGGDTQQTLTGLVNNSHYTDRDFGFADRSLRMVNTTVQTWNLYSGGSQTLNLTHCILGEVITYGTSVCNMTRCTMDGTGGYLGAWDTSLLTCTFCNATCEIMNTGGSFLFYLYSSQTVDGMVLRQNASVLLFNSVLMRDPVMKDASLALDLALTEPFHQAPVDSDVPVIGSSRILTGPDKPTEFESFRLEYGEGSAPETWTALGSEQSEPVANGELAVWDTRGLTPGIYTLRLWTDISDIAPLSVDKAVELGVYPTYTPGPSPTPTPTPIPPGLTVDLNMETSNIQPGDAFRLFLNVSNGDSDPILSDIYIVMMVGGSAWFWDTWSETPDFQRRIFPEEWISEELILDFVWPDVNGSGSGQFYGVAMSPGTFDMLSDLSVVEFLWE